MRLLAAIRRLARQYAHPTSGVRLNVPDATRIETEIARRVRQANLNEIPPLLWNELENHLDHNPALGVALARVLHAIAKRRRNRLDRVTADLALIRALNISGEYNRVVHLCAGAVARAAKLKKREIVARLWLEAAWAQVYLGNLETAQTHLETARTALSGTVPDLEIELRLEWIQARILRERGEFNIALARFESIRERWLAAGNVLTATRALCEIGLTRTRLNPSTALPPLEQALQIFQEADCPTDAALCQCILAQAKMDMGRFQEARTDLLASQTTARTHGLRFLDAVCTFELGYLACEQTEFPDAIAYTTTAHDLFDELNASQELASTKVNLGWIMTRLDRFEQALEYLHSAAQLALDGGRQTKAAVCYGNIGSVYFKQGHYAQALEYQLRAREIFARQNMVERLIECDLELGYIYYAMGDYRAALAAFEYPARTSRELKMWSLLAESQLYRAHALIADGKRAAARKALTESRALFVKNKQSAFIALCDRLAAKIEPDRRAALAGLERSRRNFQRHELDVEVALCDLTRAELQIEWRDWAAAKSSLVRANQVLGEAFPDQSWRVAYNLARVAQAQNDLAQAQQYYAQTAQLLARLRGAMWVESFSNVLFASRRYALDNALEFFAQQQFRENALALIETAKAQVFVHSLGVREWRTGERDQPEVKALVAREQELYRQLQTARAQSTFQVAPGTPTSTRGIEFSERGLAQRTAERQALANEYEKVVARLHLIQQGLRGVPDLSPFDLDAFRDMANTRWGQDWNVLSYYFAQDRLYIVWLSPHTLQVTFAPWSDDDQAALNRAAGTHANVRELVYNQTIHGVRAPGDPTESLRYLAKRLIPAELLASTQDQICIVVPHGTLHLLPFAALLGESAPLLEHLTFLYTPGLQALVQLAQAAPTTRTRPRFLTLGVESFVDRAPTLEHTRAEIDSMESLLGKQATVRWQKDATRAWLLKQNDAHALRRFDHLHFATHAIVEMEAPHTGRILLADGDLTVLEILDLDLNARLVTLSVCSSAVGKGGSGDEWVGLARAFFYAGARAIVASLWAVDDQSTVQLMEKFYKNLNNGYSIARSLQMAQASLRALGYSPYQWAPFIAIGAD